MKKNILKMVGLVIVSGMLSLLGQNLMDEATETFKSEFHGKIPMIAPPMERKEDKNED